MTTPDFTEHENLEERRLAILSEDQQRLRRQFNWLLGLLLGMLLLVGALAAIAIRTMSEKEQLETQVETLSAGNKAEFDQVKTLDSRVNALEKQTNLLNQRVPKGLPNQLKTTQAQIKGLQGQTSELEAEVTVLEQVNQALQVELKKQNAARRSPQPGKSP